VGTWSASPGYGQGAIPGLPGSQPDAAANALFGANGGAGPEGDAGDVWEALTADPAAAPDFAPGAEAAEAPDAGSEPEGAAFEDYDEAAFEPQQAAAALASPTRRPSEPLAPGRAVPIPPPEPIHMKRRGSRLRTLVVALAILVIVGAAGFGVGYLLPTMLLSLPAAASATASPTVTPAATPTPAPTASPTPTPTPTATPQPTPTPTPKEIIYVVKPNDQLLRIAKKFGVTMEAIMKLNGITDPNRIVVGQKLRIPPKPAPSPSS
jgi:LysM repeat protein